MKYDDIVSPRDNEFQYENRTVGKTVVGIKDKTSNAIASYERALVSPRITEKS